MLSMRALQKFLSIALLAVLGLPFVSPLFALAARSETGVAACCLRNGVHHCTGNTEETASLLASLSLADPSVGAIPVKCPYAPASLITGNGEAFALPVAQAVYAGWVSHPAVVAQTESMLRISRGRSRQKRGPPVFSSL
jgi:hypothetical protein